MSFVTTEIQGAVAIVTIDRPKALNALNPEVLADLKAAFEAIDQNTVRCVVLTGAGDKSFVAGADIGSMSTMTKAEGEASVSWAMMCSWRSKASRCPLSQLSTALPLAAAMSWP